MIEPLVRYYGALDEVDAVPPLGYSAQKISFAVVLGPDGTVADIVDVRDHAGKTAQPRHERVPRPVMRTRSIACNFLWDKTAYVFGASASSNRALQEHGHFRKFHLHLLRNANDEGLMALLAFLSDWRPALYKTLPHAGEMLDRNVAFRFADTASFLHTRAEARQLWAEHLARGKSEKGFCCVTGRHEAIARIHPVLKGVPGSRGSGASLVSFNLDAFTSYGKEHGANAPVSEPAAHAYAAVLNTLLTRVDTEDPNSRTRYRNRFPIGYGTALFWADPERGLEAAERAERIFGWCVDPPTPTHDEHAARVQTVLRKVWRRGPGDDIEPGVPAEMQFYIVGLSPNAGRLSVRFFLQSTLGDVLWHTAEHWRDLGIEPHRWTVLVAVPRLLRETGRQHELTNTPPVLAGDLVRSIFSGGRYPRSALAVTLMRIRADSEVNDLRAAMLRGCLARDFRTGFEQEDVPVTLDRSEINPGYRLGRLFAVLEQAQHGASGELKETIRHRYFAPAMGSPVRMFPPLLRGFQHHLSAMRRKGSHGLAHWFDELVAEVMSGLSCSRPFPTALRVEDQGRFAVGYHHQRYAKGGGRASKVLPENKDER